MRSFFTTARLCVLALCIAAGSLRLHAQVRYVTLRAVKSPVPPIALFPTAPQTAPVPQPAPVQASVAPVPIQPSLDKAELDRRVVAFQKKRAEEGSSSAQYELGLRYLTGNGVAKNIALGREWLKQAAQAGETQAQDKLRELDRAKQGH